MNKAGRIGLIIGWLASNSAFVEPSPARSGVVTAPIAQSAQTLLRNLLETPAGRGGDAGVIIDQAVADRIDRLTASMRPDRVVHTPHFSLHSYGPIDLGMTLTQFADFMEGALQQLTSGPYGFDPPPYDRINVHLIYHPNALTGRAVYRAPSLYRETSIQILAPFVAQEQIVHELFHTIQFAYLSAVSYELWWLEAQATWAGRILREWKYDRRYTRYDARMNAWWTHADELDPSCTLDGYEWLPFWRFLTEKASRHSNLPETAYGHGWETIRNFLEGVRTMVWTRSSYEDLVVQALRSNPRYADYTFMDLHRDVCLAGPLKDLNDPAVQPDFDFAMDETVPYRDCIHIDVPPEGCKGAMGFDSPFSYDSSFMRNRMYGNLSEADYIPPFIPFGHAYLRWIPGTETAGLRVRFDSDNIAAYMIPVFHPDPHGPDGRLCAEIADVLRPLPLNEEFIVRLDAFPRERPNALVFVLINQGRGSERIDYRFDPL